MTKLLTVIVLWLSANFDLPETQDLPQVVTVPETRIATLRQEVALTARPVTALPVQPSPPPVMAFYSDLSHTIYLHDTWTGDTPAELSVLVHEMVHHLQNAGGLRYPCPAAREKLAFAAQERWLGLFGTSLESEFGLDPMTILVRTTCTY